MLELTQGAALSEWGTAPELSEADLNSVVGGAGKLGTQAGESDTKPQDTQ